MKQKNQQQAHSIADFVKLITKDCFHELNWMKLDFNNH